VADAIVQRSVRAVIRDSLFSVHFVISCGLGLWVLLTVVAHLDRQVYAPPLGVRSVAELRRVIPVRPQGALLGYAPVVSLAELIDLRAIGPRFLFAGYSPQRVDMMLHGQLRGVNAAVVTDGFFPLLGSPIEVGRGIESSDDREGGLVAVVISHTLWRTAFGSSSATVGSVFRINDVPARIIGISRADFLGLDGVATDLWLPAQSAPVLTASLARTSPYLSVISRRLAHDFPPTMSVVPRGSRADGQIERIAFARLTRSRHGLSKSQLRASALAIAFGFGIMTLGAANCALVCFASVANRRAAWFVRMLLGARRIHLACEIAAKTTPLSIIALIGALTLTRLTSDVFAHRGFDRLPSFHGFRLVLFALAVISVVVALTLIASFAPLSSHWRLSPAIPTAHGKARGAATFFYVTIVCALIVVVVPVWMGFARARRIDSGFNASGLWVAEVNLPPNPADRRSLAKVKRTSEYLMRLPGVTAVGAGTGFPYLAFTAVTTGTPAGTGDLHTGVWYVDKGFTGALGLRVFAGHNSDGEEGIAVNQTFATSHRSIPLGSCLTLDAKCFRVTSILRDFDVAAVGEHRALALLPLEHADSFRQVFFAIRLERQQSASLIRAALTHEYGSVRLDAVDGLIADQTASMRGLASLASLFMALGITLALLGLRACIRTAHAQRRVVLGILSALGAPESLLLRLAVREVFIPAACGSIAGIGLGLGTFRVLGSFFAMPGATVGMQVVAGCLATAILGVGTIPLAVRMSRSSARELLSGS
jgi:hypothetical protein